MSHNLRYFSFLFCLGIVFVLTSSVESQDMPDNELKNRSDREQAAEIAKEVLDIIRRGRNPDAEPKIKRLISDNLKVGASSARIGAFFEKHNIPYSYDGFSGRYQAIVRDVGHDPSIHQAIVIHIYVDEYKNFVRATVRESFRVP